MTTFPAPGLPAKAATLENSNQRKTVATAERKRAAGNLYDDTPEEIAEHEYAAKVLGWRAKERGMTLDEYLRTNPTQPYAIPKNQ